MNHLKARQRKDGRYDYTQGNDGFVYPVGYCAGWHDWTPEECNRYGMTETVLAQMAEFRSKYHQDGHATPEEAQACYKAHQLDQEMSTTTDSHSQHKCEVCGAWTQGLVRVGGYRLFVLCEQHANRTELEKLYRVGESWES